MDKEELTRNTYNSIAENWAEGHSDPDFWKEEFQVFFNLLPQGKILDLGCGSARDSRVFIEKGYGYVGVDYSSGLLNVARQKFPNTEFVEGNILDLPFNNNEFDGFWAADSLLHIPKEKMEIARNEIKRVVKQNGTGVIIVKKGIGERIEQDEDGERFFVYWQKEELENVLQSNGYKVLEVREKQMSEKTTWLIFYVQVA